MKQLFRPSAVLLAVALLGLGCASSGPEAPVASVPESAKPFLLDPASGYPLTLSAAQAGQVRGLHSRLMSGAIPAPLAGEAEALYEQDRSLAALAVVAAQARYLAGQKPAALALVQPVLDELPDYLAAALLAARIQEEAGRVLEAHDRYASVASGSRLASQKMNELRPRATEIVARRFDDAVTRGRFDDAESELARLELYGVEEIALLEARQRLLQASGDEQGELETLRKLVEMGQSDEMGSATYQRRRGELEIDIGDVRSGLEIFEALAAAHPEDAELAEWLVRAKFAWRLALLPPEVKELGRRGELARSDLASLLYWLFPDVRYSAIEDPPIAADILEHPKQQEILRVLDLDLMAVDEALHRFRPGEPATRSDLLAALLGLLLGADPPLGCLAAEVGQSVSIKPQRWVCARAAECGLIDDSLACLPTAVLAGSEALQLVRVAQDLTATR